MKKYSLQVFNTATNQHQTLNVNNDFKQLLNALNECFLLPSTFTMCYCFNHQDRVIYLACPRDFQLYLERIEKSNNKYMPMLQIIEMKEEKFVPKELLQEAEEIQMKLSYSYSQISSGKSEVEEVQNELENIILSRQQSHDSNEYQKCQICYKDLDKQYYRCLTCLFYQICSECNKQQRFKQHVEHHIFILCQKVLSWDTLKQSAITKIQQQKQKLKFRIHRPTIHEQIACDSCNANPVQGLRYKCVDCPDFDLCGKCIDVFQHFDTHNFIQLPMNIEFIKFN